MMRCSLRMRSSRHTHRRLRVGKVLPRVVQLPMKGRLLSSTNRRDGPATSRLLLLPCPRGQSRRHRHRLYRCRRVRWHWHTKMRSRGRGSPPLLLRLRHLRRRRLRLRRLRRLRLRRLRHQRHHDLLRRLQLAFHPERLRLSSTSRRWRISRRRTRAQYDYVCERAVE